MKIQEASEDITKGGIMISSPMTSYMKSNTQKDEETGDYTHKHTIMHLEHAARRLECVPCAMSILTCLKHTKRHMRPRHVA